MPLHRCRRNLEGFGSFFDGEAAKIPKLDDLGLLRIQRRELLERRVERQNVDAARKAVQEADIVIFGLYGRVRSGAKNSVGVPENGAAILREALAANKKVIGISFGNPYVLGAFPEMKTYLVAYGDMPSLQRAAARSVLGLQDVTGKLPISLPGLHPRGTGIQLIKK